jgi:subtilisin family serine protease
MRKTLIILLRINYILAAIAILLAVMISFEAKSANINVLIIDTGIDKNPAFRHVQYVENNVNYKDVHGHGTGVASIVEYGNLDNPDPICDSVKIYSCRAFFLTTKDVNDAESNKKCLAWALQNNIDIINYSAGGTTADYIERNILKKINDKGIMVVAASGNNNEPLSKEPFYPAMYAKDHCVKDGGSGFTSKERCKGYNYALKNIKIVGNLDGKLIQRQSNYGNEVDYWEPGTNILSYTVGGIKIRFTGSSQAAAMFTHKLLKKHCDGSKEKGK